MAKHYHYTPQGTCSRDIEITVGDDGRIENVTFTGGCHGNLQGIGSLVKGMTPQEVIGRLQGIRCGS